MKKILIPLVALMLLCGCEVEETNSEDVEKNKYDHNQDNNISVYVDYKTCVEYLKLAEWYDRAGAGGLTVRYNKDGKIRTNKACLEEKQKNSDK